jgi:choline-sulfatase
MKRNPRIVRGFALATLFVAIACHRETPSAKHAASPSEPRPSILLVTLDTTRADAIGPDALGVVTPSFNALAARGRRYRQAYTPVPQTLPSHTSMMTGLYPAGHGVHENGRYLSDKQNLLAERLRSAGYRTAAFVSAFALARRFGLARGFDTYDDEFGHGRAERAAAETTDRVIDYLRNEGTQPIFLWVHYYDPHYPYTPPEPYRTRYAKQPYLGEVAAMDEQLGRLVGAVEKRVHGPVAIIIVGDHGEGLGEHGESQHGDLLYQAAVHVPLLLIGPGVSAGVTDMPVSTRRIFHTILDWAGLDTEQSLRRADEPVVLGEAMKPFLDYGWQPQLMAVEGRQKAIMAGGKTEIYDVIADPKELHDLASEAGLSRPARAALRDYPVPSPQSTQAPANLSDEDRHKLASLGYVASETKPVIRSDAPRPSDMAGLFDSLDKASSLFVQEQYAQAIPLLEKILATDPHNLDAALRLATAHSSLGHEAAADKAFQKADAIAPDSPDVRTYMALHFARSKQWERAVPMLERIVSEDPDRLPPLEALAVIRERQGRIDDAIRLRQSIYNRRVPSAAELVRLGEMAMSTGHTDLAIDSFERARGLRGAAFVHNLELGVLYLAAGRLPEAKQALDKVPRSDRGYAMALFKRAQVSVLLHEPDQADRIALARQHADATTRELIARERLFRPSR